MNHSETRIIAEAGSNHNGNTDDAIKLIDIAKKANADSVKFQFIFAEGLYLPEYLVDGNYSQSAVFHQRKREELSESEWRDIWEYANEIGMDISASVFCSRGINLLSKLGCSYVKIASTDLTNHYLIKQACETFSDVILSTGMASLGEIASAVQAALKANPRVRLKLMHCVSLYPCDFHDAKLSRITALQNAFDVEVGYSDHTSDEHSAILAWGEGARLFEKHFTFDQTLPGFDHAHALSPMQLSTYCKLLKGCGDAMKWTESEFSEEGGEAETRIRARRGVYASRDLKKGHVVCESDVLYVRPSTSQLCTDPADFLGCVLESDVPRFAAIGNTSSVAEVTSNVSAASSYWRNEMREKGMSNND